MKHFVLKTGIGSVALFGTAAAAFAQEAPALVTAASTEVGKMTSAVETIAPLALAVVAAIVLFGIVTSFLRKGR